MVTQLKYLGCNTMELSTRKWSSVVIKGQSNNLSCHDEGAKIVISRCEMLQIYFTNIISALSQLSWHKSKKTLPGWITAILHSMQLAQGFHQAFDLAKSLYQSRFVKYCSDLSVMFSCYSISIHRNCISGQLTKSLLRSTCPCIGENWRNKSVGKNFISSSHSNPFH